MSSQPFESEKDRHLRRQALTRLTGQPNPCDTRANGAAALRVLYELASSPVTAPDAQVLLHELQVYQVELELQDEELRHARTELEEALVRQTQRCEHAPFGYYTVDAATRLQEINLAGARLLGRDRQALLGRALDDFLAPDSARALRALLVRAGEGGPPPACALHLRAPNQAMQLVHASVNVHPAGKRFLVALVDSGGVAAKGI
jgi:PAS domain-containing protein